MSNSTFTPGDRVRDTDKNITGTVVDDPAMSKEYIGMIPVHWDNGDRTVASPSILAPAGFEVFTEAEIQAEIDRRKDEAYEAARVTAVEYLQETPTLATETVSLSALIHAAHETELPVSALVEAWGIVTGTAL